MKSLMSIALCGVCLTALSTPAFAQGAGGTPEVVEASDVDEIVVSARRRDESAQDVPLVVNAVTSESIQKLNIRSFTEIQTLVPGLSLSTIGNGTGGNATLRGVNFDINASGNNPTVEFYLNDAPISSGFVLQSMYDVGQIEVLRGPQGTLRGRASPSGSITLTTRKPDLYEIGGTAQTTINDIGTLNTNGGFNLPIIEGIAAIRVAGLWDENDADRVKTANGLLDKRNPYGRTHSGRISARVQPIDALLLDASYQTLDRRSRTYDQVESFNQINPAAAPSAVTITAKDRLGILDRPRVVHQEQDVYNWQAQFSFAGQRLVYVGSHYTLDLHSFNSSDLGNRFVGAEPGQELHTTSKSTSHEVRMQNDERVFGMFDYVVGAFDSKLSSPSDLIDQTPVALPAFLGGGLATVANTPVSRRGTTHEQSVFGNVTAHLGDMTEFSGGLRYIDYRAKGTLQVAGGTIIPDPTVKENKVVYTASAKHKLSDDFMVYANTGSSWRPPVNAIGDFAVVKSARQLGFTFLPPESSKSYEIGFKSTMLDKKLRFNVSAFHQKFKNYPYRVPGAPRTSGVYYINNAASVVNGVVTINPSVSQFNFVGAVPVTVNGVETEIAFAPTKNWDMGVVAAYSMGKIKNGYIPCNDINGDGVPDNVTTAPTLAQLQASVGANNIAGCNVSQRSSLQSPFSATIQSEYRVGLTSEIQGYVRGLFNYYGKSQSDPTFSFDDVKSYGLLNLYTGIKAPTGAWEVSFFVKNVFNTTKVLTRTTPLATPFQELQPPTFRTTAARVFTSSYTGITTTPPQEFGLTMRWSFGSR